MKKKEPIINLVYAIMLEIIIGFAAALIKKSLQWVKRSVLELQCFWCRQKVLQFCFLHWQSLTSQSFCFIGVLIEQTQPFLLLKNFSMLCHLDLSVNLILHVMWLIGHKILKSNYHAVSEQLLILNISDFKNMMVFHAKAFSRQSQLMT